MRKSQKLLIFSLLCLMLLVSICFIYRLPNNLACNVIRFIIVILGIISYALSVYQHNKEIKIDFEKELNTLKEDYKDINSLVESFTNNSYNNLNSNLVETCYLSINTTDDYLMHYYRNILKIKAFNNNELISNDFINLACLMDSLVSAWKIESNIVLDNASVKKLLVANCEIAISVTFYLMNLSYENFKDNMYVTELLRLLVISYLDNDCGKVSTIEYEKTVLELIYSELYTKSD